MIAFEKTFPLYTKYRFHFIVLGVGGTGSELIPKIARTIHFLNLNVNPNSLKPIQHKLTICDADDVEEKNICRQNFFSSDLGMNKAEAIAYKCNALFNLDIVAINRYVENPDDLTNIIHAFDAQGTADSYQFVPFIIGCVDTNAVRAMLHSYCSSYRGNKIFYLDCGNEEFYGQVVLGHKLAGGNTLVAMSDTFYAYNLPFMGDVYPDILTSNDKFTSQLSCAEAAVSNPQAFDTNIMAACTAFQMIENCLRGSLSYHKVTFDVINGNTHTTFNKESTLAPYGIKVPDKYKTEVPKIDTSVKVEVTGEESIPVTSKKKVNKK